MGWYIFASGIAGLLLGFIIGANAGKGATIRDGYAGYYDVNNSTMYLDPKVEHENIPEKEYLVLEIIDLSSPIIRTIKAEKEN